MNMEHLSAAQFGADEGHGFTDTQRYLKSDRNGKTYRLQDYGNNTIGAHVVTAKNDPNKYPTHQSAVGQLTFFGGRPQYDGSNTDGGVIYKAIVRDRHQRQGLATAMLDFARDRHPEKDVRHSNALSDDGAAWARATPTENDLRRQRDV